METPQNLAELLNADGFKSIPKSFIREILKVTAHSDIISFAGGLPNPAFFPVQEIQAAAMKALEKDGRRLLQYGESEGYRPLREYIAARYKQKHNLEVDPDVILITNGSQQGLDLVSKVFLNKGDRVLMERPAYLGAIQAFSAYNADIRTINLLDDGPDIERLTEILDKQKVKLFYGIPNFQNPTGISYSIEKRKQVAEIMNRFPSLFIEDDPYGDIRFSGENLPPIKSYLNEQTILLGSFSKTISPGMRMGWVVASKEIMQKLLIAKQLTDLHSNNLSQRVIYQYLMDNDFDNHINKINETYKRQCDLMVEAIMEYFPHDVKVTQPQGGMFLWLTLKESQNTMELFKIAIKEKVAFVPGNSFYPKNDCHNTMRLNFSNSDEIKIKQGIKILGNILKRNSS
ncbi:MAG TPA: PLP-dependent aminotransferase family protein [Sphingobacteriaceae bacterium]